MLRPALLEMFTAKRLLSFSMFPNEAIWKTKGNNSISIYRFSNVYCKNETKEAAAAE